MAAARFTYDIALSRPGRELETLNEIIDGLQREIRPLEEHAVGWWAGSMPSCTMESILVDVEGPFELDGHYWISKEGVQITSSTFLEQSRQALSALTAIQKNNFWNLVSYNMFGKKQFNIERLVLRIPGPFHEHETEEYHAADGTILSRTLFYFYYQETCAINRDRAMKMANYRKYGYYCRG